MAIDNKVTNTLKTFSINKLFGFITKFVALLLFVSNPLIVKSADIPLSGQTLNSTINLSTIQSYSCPGECSCKLNDDHSITTDCTNANLTALPNNINPNTTVLNINQNPISNLTEDEFSVLNNLKRIWINDNNLEEIPTHIFKTLAKLEALSIANNRIKVINDFAFKPLIHLAILDLQNNRIEDIKALAFDGLKSLKILEINGNSLKSVPNALSKLHSLRELTLANNQIKYIAENSFRNNPFLTILEIKGNPLEEVANNAFIDLPFLKKLTLSEVSKLKVLPNFSGTTTLEHLKIDRGQLRNIPPSLCQQTPHLKSLIVKSNKINSFPKLSGCHELKLLDFSYNHIKTFGDEPNFINQTKLIDLFMGHNLITDIPQNAFLGLSSLKVLNLVRNRITAIHTKAFVPLLSLKDLNLGDNRFPTLPTEGLQNITEIKVYGNPNLKEFPPVDTFPRVHTLALSYAYHCCAYIGRTHSPTLNPKSLEESIVWLDKEDVWNTNMTDVWPGYTNFSTKFEELANQLWKNFGRDYVIPDNIAEYAEQYFEDYKPNPNPDESLITSFPIQCLPQPGPFMPCKDLFDWWTLRCGVWIVFLLALLGNGVVVVVLIFGRSKIDVPRFLVCNLAIADFFMGVYLGVLAIVDASTLGEFKIYAIRWQTSWGCQVAGFFGVFSSELSVYTLAVITMERNYAITHAMHLNKRLSLRHAAYIMSIGWTFAICMAVLPLIGISDYRKFAVCLPFEVEDSVWSLTYVVFLILINGVAFLVLMGCYLRMYCAIRGSQAWNSNDSRIAKRMALLVFTDFLCWAPIAFFSLTAVSGLHLISLEEAKVFTIFILPLNSCANPFLYAIFTKQFKKDCVLLCKRIEESRVTRGIGRCRHSSNFSNRHTPAVSNSAIERKSIGSDQLPQIVCQCGVRKPKVSIEEVRLITTLKPTLSWKQKAIDWFSFSKRNDSQKSINENINQNFQNQKNIERLGGRAASISSDNFSSRSDSWRNANIPLKNIEKLNRNTVRQTNAQAIRGRRNSWNVSRKTSQDSSMCSRQDSTSTSTYTSRISRSSFSSESSSKPTTSTSSSGAGPSGLQKHDLTSKTQLNRQTAIDETKPQKSPPNRLETGNYLCHNCANRKEGPQQQTLSPKNIKFKNKELEEKFNCFYNRLAEASQDDSSEGPDPVIVSTESTAENKLDLSTQSRDTAETSLQESTTSQENEMRRFQTQPSIEIAPQTPMTDKSFDDFDGLFQSRTSSSHSGQTTIHYSGETIKDPNRLDVSPENITKTHSMTDFGFTENTSHKTRKVSSENSLKKLSIKNLPSLLRSLSGQTNTNTNIKRQKTLKSRKSRSYYRSADNMSRLESYSCEAINHQMSDSVLNKRRSTAFELYQTKQDYYSSDYEDIEDQNLIREERTELTSDKTISDCKDCKVSKEIVEQNVQMSSSLTTNEDMPLIGAHVSQI